MTAGERKAWALAGAVAGVLAFADPAGAQLGAPLGGLPALPSLPAPSVRGVVAGAVDAVGETARLADARVLHLRALLRANPHALETDDAGQPVVRGQILTASPTPRSLDLARSAGFTVAGQTQVESLGMVLVVLEAPKGEPVRAAIKRLRALDPEGGYDFNHLYSGSGGLGAPGDAAAPTPSRPGEARLGLLDTGVAAGLAVFAGVAIEQQGFAPGGLKAGAHGTAVASLMVGRLGPFHGAAPGAALRVADVYGAGPTGGSADAIVRALGWMAQAKTAVINISLVGPPNAVLAAAVRATLARGAVIVAAVGNDGPAAPPLYPAAYLGVISVTAVDARRRVLLEAGRSGHVDFAAPGADMAAAAPKGGFVTVRGTSFAAPIVAGLIASEGGGAPADAVAALARQAVDLGAPGPDPVYGKGLVGEAVRTPPAAVHARTSP